MRSTANGSRRCTDCGASAASLVAERSAGLADRGVAQRRRLLRFRGASPAQNFTGLGNALPAHHAGALVERPIARLRAAGKKTELGGFAVDEGVGLAPLAHVHE